MVKSPELSAYQTYLNGQLCLSRGAMSAEGAIITGYIRSPHYSKLVPKRGTSLVGATDIIRAQPVT